MPATIDLRDGSAADYRDRLFETLDDADPGEAFAVVADRDLDPHLVRYQLDRDRSLDWTYADPDAEPRELTVTVGEALADGTLGTIDVRDLAPQRRHEALLEIFEELGADEGFVLVNDHDPKPLYHELRSMHGDVIDWAYASRESDEFRVEVVKTDASSADADDVITRYDVRDIPKAERHPTIHHRYGMIPAGETMELVAPHEPRPLHGEFRERYGDAFTWEVVESSSNRCRVQITKTEQADRSDGSSGTDEDSSSSPADEGQVEITETLDVRDRPPAERHELIFDAYDDLALGRGFVLVNDHDPKPLYHQFEAEAGPEFHWAYRQKDPGEFRVVIAKTETDVEASDAGEPDPPF